MNIARAHRSQWFMATMFIKVFGLPVLGKNCCAGNSHDPFAVKKRKLEDSAIDTNSDHKLTCPETESIISGRKLSDLHINFAQQLLKKQFPKLGGLQSTFYQSKNS